MSMTLNFLGGAPFQLLYDGVKLAMNNTSKFKTHLRSLKFTLDCLQPQIIEQIRLQNLQLNIPVQEIQELQRKIDEGIVLVGRLSIINTSNIRVWGSCCSCLMVSYADQLDELDESLRRLLEILRLQSLAQVNQIGILARTTRDRQDELGRRQLEILSNQRHIMDTLMKQQQIIERIEKNSVATSTGKGAPPVQVLRLGAVFQALFDTVVQVKGKNSKFKRLLEDFKFTLDCLKPLVQEIVECNKVLNFPKEEILEDFIVYLEKGVELVYKCSKSSLWNRFKRYEYINSLFELDESLQRLFNILRLQIETDVKEALVSVSKLEKEIEEIEGSFVLQHHQYESAAAEPQLPKVEVDVMNMPVTRDVMESMDSTGNVEVGDESHMRTEGSSLASHQVDVAVEEEEREPLSPTILAGITELFDSALARSNMEVGDEQTVGQGEEDKEIWQLACKEADKETRTPTVPLLAAHKRRASVETVVKNYEEHYAATRTQAAFRRQGEASSAHMPQFFSDFSFPEIEEATQNFDPSLKIGEGGYGSIFKGFLRHTEVAIKMLNAHSLQGPSEFQQEVDILSKLRHTNLVTLIGACPEAWTLIYEYLPNGSLEDRLSCKDNTSPLSWQARIRIATELCSVLIFLHSSKPHSIVHGDLNPSNILLDAHFVCKLSNFGISRLLSRGQGSSNNTTLCCRTDPKGTFTYMDPEFLSSGELTPKSDIYSFGIILLRLLTGRPALGITKEVQYALDSGKLETLLDPLAGDWPFVQAEQLARLALRCCEMSRKCRADLVSDVWRVLEPMRASCGSSSSFRLGTEEHFQPPTYFICPIFQEVMQDPHVAADGFTYEAEALRGWLDSGHDTSPMTNLKLEHKNLVPNHALRSAIQEWLQQH